MKDFVKKYSALIVIAGIFLVFAAQIELINAKFKKAGWALGGLIIVATLIISGGQLQNDLSKNKTLADNGNKPPAET